MVARNLFEKEVAYLVQANTHEWNHFWSIIRESSQACSDYLLKSTLTCMNSSSKNITARVLCGTHNWNRILWKRGLEAHVVGERAP
jgi:hypothetical protein